jgi:thiol:disulfide interchange protein DsbC
VERIAPSPVPGLYQVELKGGRIVYSSEDGRFVIQGYVYEVLEHGVKNLTAEFSADYLANLVAKVPASELVIFPAQQEKGRITVFMDVEPVLP